MTAYGSGEEEMEALNHVFQQCSAQGDQIFWNMFSVS